MRQNILMRRLDPFKEMLDIQREMNHLFNSSYGTEKHGYPAVNVWANNEDVIIKAEVPGLEKKDINLHLTNDMLTFEGAIESAKRQEGESIHRQERFSGRFKREIVLPFNVNPDKVKASMKNGVLTITLPRAEADKPKQISIL